MNPGLSPILFYFFNEIPTRTRGGSEHKISIGVPIIYSVGCVSCVYIFETEVGRKVGGDLVKSFS